MGPGGRVVKFHFRSNPKMADCAQIGNLDIFWHFLALFGSKISG